MNQDSREFNRNAQSLDTTSQARLQMRQLPNAHCGRRDPSHNDKRDSGLLTPLPDRREREVTGAVSMARDARLVRASRLGACPRKFSRRFQQIRCQEGFGKTGKQLLPWRDAKSGCAVAKQNEDAVMVWFLRLRAACAVSGRKALVHEKAPTTHSAHFRLGASFMGGEFSDRRFQLV
jgi:hypothetical protein